MATGYALCIGVGDLDPSAYANDRGILVGPVNDATAIWRELAKANFRGPPPIMTEDATQVAILGEIDQVMRKVEPDDLFVLYYSGHGSQIPNTDEPDGLDETWCAYDGEIIDDELWLALISPQRPCRVLTIVDSCHSHTSVAYKAARAVRFSARIKALTKRTARDVYESHSADFLARQAMIRSAPRNVVQGLRVMELAACDAPQTAADASDGSPYSLFTRWFLDELRKGAADYRDLMARIDGRIGLRQTPKIAFPLGDERGFQGDRPFAV